MKNCHKDRSLLKRSKRSFFAYTSMYTSGDFSADQAYEIRQWCNIEEHPKSAV